MTEDGREWEKKGKAETGERMSEIGKWRNFEKISRAVCHGSPESHRKPPFASPGAMVIRGFQSMAAVLRSFFMEYQRKKEGWFNILI